MEWLSSSSAKILFSSSVDRCSSPSLIIITTDDEGEEDSSSQPDLISISSDDSADMEATVSGIDRIRDRSEAMTNEQNFYKEVVRILNLRDDDECYVASSGLVLHTLHWLAIELTTWLGRCSGGSM